MPDDTCTIDDFGPLTLHAPASVGELSDLVRRASAEQQALYPLGGRTMLGLGNRPARPGWAVDTTRFHQVIDYPARDMTITLQAGIPIARLQEILAPENQRLPIDVPQADRATLGGIIAVNTSGSLRHGYGTLRDYVLGISAVNDEGQEIKAGGRVVKNVAGYDLCKLFVGSLGTLGIITQVTLKLRPLPEERALITLGCSAATLGSTLDLLHRSRTRPVCMDAFNQSAAQWINQRTRCCDDTAWTVVVGYEGNAETVKWQVQQLILELRGTCPLEAFVGPPARPLASAMTDFPGGTHPDEMVFKANMLASATANFCREADALPQRPLLQAHAGNGIVIGRWGAGLSEPEAATLLQKLRELASHGQGHVIVLHCPPAWKDTLNVWGPPRQDAWLMRAVKEKLDPRRIFNAGRFVDGI